MHLLVWISFGLSCSVIDQRYGASRSEGQITHEEDSAAGSLLGETSLTVCTETLMRVKKAADL